MKKILFVSKRMISEMENFFQIYMTDLFNSAVAMAKNNPKYFDAVSIDTNIWSNDQVEQFVQNISSNIPIFLWGKSSINGKGIIHVHKYENIVKEMYDFLHPESLSGIMNKSISVPVANINKDILLLLISDVMNSDLESVYKLRRANTLFMASTWIEAMPSYFSLIVINMTRIMKITDFHEIVKFVNNSALPVVIFGEDIPNKNENVGFISKTNNLAEGVGVFYNSILKID